VSKAKRKPAAQPSKRKETPRNLPELPGADNSDTRLCWRFTHVDNEGPWGLSRLEMAVVTQLLGHLTKFEKMTINEAFHNGGYPGKDYEVDSLPNPEARDRLEALGLADQTKIWNLRCGGKERIWGFLTGNVFHVVFWDPDHAIWPSQLKHT